MSFNLEYYIPESHGITVENFWPVRAGQKSVLEILEEQIQRYESRKGVRV